MIKWIAFFCCFVIGGVRAAPTVTLLSLLEEMVDRERLAKFPEPAYTCRQFSSYDRGSVSPDKPGWFANDDRTHFLRTETGRGRREFVLFDAAGPGAVVRFWVTVAKSDGSGILRVYLDGSDKPAIEGPVLEVLSGGQLCGRPLSDSVSEKTDYLKRGHNLYLPIPYASRCVVTYESAAIAEPDRNNGENFYYNINYRTYDRGVAVETFSREKLKRDAVAVSELRRRLAGGERGLTGKALSTVTFDGIIQPGQQLVRRVEGMRAVRLLAMNLDGGREQQSLRSVVVEMLFDGQRTVWVPAGDFFGTGHKLSPCRTWYTEVTGDGRLEAAWVMPFKKQCELKLLNVGQAPVTVTDGALITAPWAWDAQSMYFGAGWCGQNKLRTRRDNQHFDVNYATLKGEGVLVGTGVTLFNTSNNWWGEGDEKVFVDGEAFPSHIGTGTEDYYGYAWSNPNVFEHPFIAQPDGTGANRTGHVVNLRYRALDAIPFRSRLQFDMEMWHWADTVINHAPTTYWYMKPGGAANRGPEPEQAGRAVARVRRDVVVLAPFTAGRLEGEALEGEATHGGVKPQAIAEHKWSGGSQLWWTDGRPGDTARFTFAMAEGGRFSLKAALTHAPDYAQADVLLNDKPLARGYDAYANKVETRLADWGVVDLQMGENVLSVVLTGANPLAQKDRFFWGIDYLEITKSAE